MSDPAGLIGQRFARVVVEVSHIIVFFLLLDQLAHSALVRQLLVRLTPVSLRSRVQSVLEHPITRAILRLRWLAMDILAYSVIGLYFTTVDISLQRYFGRHIEWSYGSVVALVPWAPVFAKFLYMNVCTSHPRLHFPHIYLSTHELMKL